MATVPKPARSQAVPSVQRLMPTPPMEVAYQLKGLAGSMATASPSPLRTWDHGVVKSAPGAAVPRGPRAASHVEGVAGSWAKPAICAREPRPLLRVLKRLGACGGTKG